MSLRGLLFMVLFMVLFAVSCSWYNAQSPAGHPGAAGGLTHQARMGLVGRVRSAARRAGEACLAALALLHDAPRRSTSSQSSHSHLLHLSELKAPGAECVSVRSWRRG